MNIIDISSWQAGIDLATLFAQNPLDGVIVKATEGVSYINPDYASQTAWLSANEKPFGFYHYCSGADARAEAEFFYNTVKPYIGRGIPVADYEGEATLKGTSWLKEFLERFYTLSGVKAMIYCSLSVIQGQDFSALTDHPLWLAQYADMNPVYGFVEHPWQNGSVYPFMGFYMQQYTSNGHLNGWGGSLDFDKFWWNEDDWNSIAKSEKQDSSKGADPDIVSRVLHNEFGTGQDRYDRLSMLGYDPQAVQDKINELYSIAQSCKKYIDGNNEYLPSITEIISNL